MKVTLSARFWFVAVWIVLAAITAVGSGWLMRNYIHYYLAVFVLFIFSGFAQFFYKKYKASVARLLISSISVGMILGGILGFFWDTVFS